MKENIDLALRLFCDKSDSLRPVQLNPFMCEELACATNSYILLAVRNHETKEYYNGNGEHGLGRCPNVKAIIPTSYHHCGYILVSDIEKAIKSDNYSCKILEMYFKSKDLETVVEASKLLGINAWKVDVDAYKLILTTEDENVIILVMPWEEKGVEIEVLHLLQSECVSEINESLAKSYLKEYRRKEQERIEEEQRKKEEYDRSHHKIWKIYVKRTDVGVLLVEAPDEETAFAIAEHEASEATFDDDYEYEVDEDDFEEDVEHYEIQRDYSRDSIATPEKTKYGYKFIRVDEYEHFDEEE